MCAHQTAIPTKDANIAREALEILVTCLQLRSELIGQLCCVVIVCFFSVPSSPVMPWRFWSCSELIVQLCCFVLGFFCSDDTNKLKWHAAVWMVLNWVKCEVEVVGEDCGHLSLRVVG